MGQIVALFPHHWNDYPIALHTQKTIPPEQISQVAGSPVCGR
jgi:hypothetical protein